MQSASLLKDSLNTHRPFAFNPVFFVLYLKGELR